MTRYIMDQFKNISIVGLLLSLLIACDTVPDDEIKTAAEKGLVNLPEHDLIFVSDRDPDKNLEVYTLDTDGNFKQLTNDDRFDCHWPRPSPDGTSILFYRQLESAGRQEYDKFALWTMDRDGENERELLPVGSHGWSSQGVVDWHPDGTKLVMAGETSHWNLYVTEVDGTNPVRISPRDGLYTDPSWSPDGTKIVYTAVPAGREINIFTIAEVFTYLEVFTADADGSNEVQHTFDDLRDHDPYFSPDGKEISFESQNGGFLSFDWDPRIVDYDNGDVRILTKNGTVPHWTPEGDALYFFSLEFAPTLRGWHISHVNKDGTNRTRITDGLLFSDSEVDVF